MADKIQVRRDSAANWTAANPTLAQGELGYELDTGRVKVGDGSTDWNTLGYNFESGGGVTDHSALTGLTDDDHTQYLTEARHDSLPFDNPHSVNATQIGLGNVPNVDATNRANHTGTQTASTISDFDTKVTNNTSVTTNTSKVSFPEAPNDGQQYARQSLGWTPVSAGGVFGTEAEDFIDLNNVAVTTATPFAAYTFTTASKPSGRYRVAINMHYEPAATNQNDEFSLRINGVQIGVEYNYEGKDTAGDNRNIVEFKGYFDHTGPGTFDIQLYASRQGNTQVIHGCQAEVWRVS